MATPQKKTSQKATKKTSTSKATKKSSASTSKKTTTTRTKKTRSKTSTKRKEKQSSKKTTTTKKSTKNPTEKKVAKTTKKTIKETTKKTTPAKKTVADGTPPEVTESASSESVQAETLKNELQIEASKPRLPWDSEVPVKEQTEQSGRKKWLGLKQQLSSSHATQQVHGADVVVPPRKRRRGKHILLTALCIIGIALVLGGLYHIYNSDNKKTLYIDTERPGTGSKILITAATFRGDDLSIELSHDICKPKDVRLYVPNKGSDDSVRNVFVYHTNDAKKCEKQEALIITQDMGDVIEQHESDIINFRILGHNNAGRTVVWRADD